jgi:hypothetical protein
MLQMYVLRARSHKDDKKHPQAPCQPGAPLHRRAVLCDWRSNDSWAFCGMQQTDLASGIAMWGAAIAMFIAGHKIENNIGSMTPVLLFRLLSKIVHNSIAQRVHLLRA